MRNLGTPSFENLSLIRQEYDHKFNSYQLDIKFHYSPDGKVDRPGYGSVVLYPLRDFVDKSRAWIGGCKENYQDWKGHVDTQLQQAIARVGPYSKIGQRDLFILEQNG